MGKSVYLCRKNMLHNVGKIDRIIRLVLALVLATVYIFELWEGKYDNYFVFGAGILFITSIRQCCPVYALLGFGTCGIQTNEKEQKIKPKNIKLN
jgi:hypothetical protein